MHAMVTAPRGTKRQLSPEPEVAEVDDNAIASAVLASNHDESPKRPSKRARTEASRSLFVHSLPPGTSDESLAIFFSEHYPVKHATVIRDPETKESRGYGFVTLADANDAARAKESLDNTEWDGRRLKVDIAKSRNREVTKGQQDEAAQPQHSSDHGRNFERPPKLIIRNLPWSIKTPDQLGELFRPFGKIKFADLPQSKGKLSGFGFVTLRGKKNAQKAMDMLNGREIDGRSIAVDFAMDRDTWLSQRDNNASEGNVKGRKDGGDIPSSEGDAGTSADADIKADLENFMKNHMQNLEDEDGESGDDGMDVDGDESVSADSLEEEDNDSGSEIPDKKPSHTDNQSTVFVRNLPFTVTDDGLKTFFGHFGKVRYARVVVNKATDRPAGTGFVCFFRQEDAKLCLRGAPRGMPTSLSGKPSVLHDENLDPTGKYTLDGRLLIVSQALSKEEASRVASKAQSKVADDKRRLFLLSEGAVDTRSTLYSLLTPAEVKAREASANQRKKLVQGNPSLHLSLTRLAVRNIPRDVTSKRLKELARQAVVGFATEVKEGRRQPLSREEIARDGAAGREAERQRKLKSKGIIRQCKVVFETRDGSKMADESGGGKSRGYGFVEYTSHRWALMGLRWLNGHLEGNSGKKQRLMVEFAIENAQVISRRFAKEERLRLAHSKQAGKQQTESENHELEQPIVEGKKSALNAQSSGKGKGKGAGGSVDMKQKLIARKRVVKKKKALARKGK